MRVSRDSGGLRPTPTSSVPTPSPESEPLTKQPVPELNSCDRPELTQTFPGFVCPGEKSFMTQIIPGEISPHHNLRTRQPQPPNPRHLRTLRSKFTLMLNGTNKSYMISLFYLCGPVQASVIRYLFWVFFGGGVTFKEHGMRSLSPPSP